MYYIFLNGRRLASPMPRELELGTNSNYSACLSQEQSVFIRANPWLLSRGRSSAAACTAESSPPLPDTVRSTARGLQSGNRRNRSPETLSSPSAQTCRRARAGIPATLLHGPRLAVAARWQDRSRA